MSTNTSARSGIGFQVWESFDSDGNTNTFTLAELERIAAQDGSQFPIDRKRVASLVKSIVNTGKVFQPIKVATYHDGKEYTHRLIGGRHRIAAIREVARLWNWDTPDDFNVDVQITWVSSIEEANAMVIYDNSSRKMSAPEVKSLSLGFGREELSDPNFIQVVLSQKSRARMFKLLAMHMHAMYFNQNGTPLMETVTVDRLTNAIVKGTLGEALPTSAKRFAQELEGASDLINALVEYFIYEVDGITRHHMRVIEQTNFGRNYSSIASAFIKEFGYFIEELVAQDDDEQQEEEEELTTDRVTTA
jgi:hypothetical protein